PTARWALPEASVLGFLAIGLLVLSVSVYFRLKRVVLNQPDQAVFGDGDTLLLFALSVYFGIDVVSILSLAAIVFIGQQAFSLLRGRYRLGAPFVPAIFVGTVLTILLARPAGIDLNRIGLDLVHN